jgi:hypothetical protein
MDRPNPQVGEEQHAVGKNGRQTTDSDIIWWEADVHSRLDEEATPPRSEEEPHSNHIKNPDAEEIRAEEVSGGEVLITRQLNRREETESRDNVRIAEKRKVSDTSGGTNDADADTETKRIKTLQELCGTPEGSHNDSSYESDDEISAGSSSSSSVEFVVPENDFIVAIDDNGKYPQGSLFPPLQELVHPTSWNTMRSASERFPPPSDADCPGSDTDHDLTSDNVPSG